MFPATSLFGGDKNNSKCMVLQDKNLCYVDIVWPMAWKMERILWIAFYHNDTNKKCYFSKLPKALVKKVITLLTETIVYG